MVWARGEFMESGDFRLAVSRYGPDRAATTGVLFLSGWPSTLANSIIPATTLAHSGKTCLIFDFPGTGASSGDPKTVTTDDCLAAAVDAYDRLNEVKGLQHIAVVGSSFGAYVAALLTEERPVACLALRAPANYPDGPFAEPLAKLFTRRPDASSPGMRRSRALRAVHQFDADVLIVEASDDTVIPSWMVDEFRDAAGTRASKVTIAGAGHSLTDEQRTAYAEALDAWMTTSLQRRMSQSASGDELTL